jgi:integrase/recombinase XerC
MDFIWRLADERGNSRIRAVLAIGEEAGLRLGEICRLREKDVDLEGRRLFVRLPNKTDCERWALFSDKTAQSLQEWISERDKYCGHELLFHNSLGGPLFPETLHRECCRTFSRTYGGKEINSVGLDAWSTHRLRHTMASNLASGGASIPTIMGAGGWRSVSSMMVYTKSDEAKARRGYDDRDLAKLASLLEFIQLTESLLDRIPAVPDLLGRVFGLRPGARLRGDSRVLPVS